MGSEKWTLLPEPIDSTCIMFAICSLGACLVLHYPGHLSGVVAIVFQSMWLGWVLFFSFGERPRLQLLLHLLVAACMSAPVFVTAGLMMRTLRS
jgi:hypothetical protein